MYKYCADQIIIRGVPEPGQQGILSHCLENACGDCQEGAAIWVSLALSFQGCPYHVQGMQKMTKVGENLSPSHDAFKPDFDS